jgi:hypothetical protein
MAENQPSPRRRFQFSLRTLMIGVTLLAIPCAYVAHEYQTVQHRQAMLELGPSKLFNYMRGDDAKLPLVRRWLGDHAVLSFGFNDPSEEKTQRYKEAFPEWDGRLDIPVP